MLLNDSYKLYLSDADVILVETDIPKECILTVQLIKWPQLVMFNRPKEAEVIACDEGACCCISCGIWHSNGSWVCLDCWEPSQSQAFTTARLTSSVQIARMK